MNIRSIKFILVGTIAAFSLAGTSSAADPIVINAKKNLPTDYAGAEKIFQANDPAVVFKLTPLPQEALERAYRLPDTNRKAIGRTAIAPVEYQAAFGVGVGVDCDARRQGRLDDAGEGAPPRLRCPYDEVYPRRATA